MLCLNENDIINAVTPEDIIEAVESAVKLYETDDFLMPDRMHVDFENKNHGKQQTNTLLLMPSFTPGQFGTKLVSVFPGNTSKDIPVVIGTMLLNDGETGEPLALLNGTALTALRTGGIGAVGLRHTAAPGIKTLGLIGAGVQGFNQLLFASYVRGISDMFVYDIDPARCDFLIKKLLEKRPSIKIHRAESVNLLLENCEAVMTATTAHEPVLPNDETLLKGKHFVGVGSFRPSMREFPEALFRLVNRVIVDTDHAVNESGDLVTPLKNGWLSKDQIMTTGRWLKEKKPPEPGETTLFKSVGMALFDLVTAGLIYGKAKDKGLGTEIRL